MNTYSKTKIYLIFAGIGGVFLLFALLLLTQGMTLKRVSSEIENNWLPSILAVSSINTLTSDYRALEALHIMATDVEMKEKHAYAMQGVIDEITQAQSEFESKISSDKERSIYQKFSKNYDSYLVTSKQIITLSENNEAAKATLTLKRGTTFFNTFSDELWKLVALNSAGSTDAVNHANATFAKTRIIIVVGGSLVVVVMLFFAVALSKARINSTNPDIVRAVQRKIALMFVVLIACLWLFNGLFYQQIRSINQKVLEMKNNWIPSIIMANSINTKTSDYRVAEALHVLSSNEDEIAKYDNEITTIAADIAALRKKYAALISSKEERALYDDFSTAYAGYLTASQQILTFSRANDNANATKFLIQSSTLAKDFSASLNDIILANQQSGIDASRSVDAGLQTLKILTFGGFAFLLVLLIIAAQLTQIWLLDEPQEASEEKSLTFFTIKMKLRLVFFGMVVVFAIFALFNNSLMQAMNKQAREIEKSWMPSIIKINNINNLISNHRNAVIRHIMASSELEMLQWEKNAKRISYNISKLTAQYQPLISSDEERDIYQKFRDSYQLYLKDSQKILLLSSQNNKANANVELKNSRAVFDTLNVNLDKLVNLNSIGGTNSAQLTTRTFNEAQQTMWAMVLVIFLLAILFMIAFDKNISVALQRLTAMVRLLSKGVISDSNDSFKHRHDEIGQMANALEVVTQTLQALASDATDLIEAAQAGVLSARVDTTRHPGEFGKIVLGMNSIIELLSKPLAEVAQIMQSLALGDLEGRISGEYEGELRILKNNVNRSLDALVSLLTELSQTMKYMANTDLTHNLTGNYQGDFAELKANTNQTMLEMIAILREITNSTSQAAVAVTQTSEASKYVAKEASLQMLAVENVSQTIAETASSVNEIAQKAKQGSELASHTLGFANDGQALLNKLIDLIQHIDAEYGKIEQITAEITRIADKTHLLSLNAGLEATRAGEYGAAFGFVAQQIGQLADEVSASARDIGGVIASSGQKVRLGVHATQETQIAMEQISTAVKNNENAVQSISVAIVQQSAAVKSLSERVSEIRVSSEASAAAAEQISATMIHLAESVRDTAAQAKRFKLDDILAKH